MTDEPRPFMSEEETAFLAAHLRKTDKVFEWGSGGSTEWLARRVRRVTSVEHQAEYAIAAIRNAQADRGRCTNTTVLFCPPDLPFTEGADDGDGEVFRTYVQAYTGRGIDVAILDGRARVSCARWIDECSLFGPFPGMRIFLHDCDRPEYRRIWDVDPTWARPHLRKVERVGSLMLLEAFL